MVRLNLAIKLKTQFFYTNVVLRRQSVGIKKIVRDGVTFFFIDNEQYFNRGTVYGEWDDGERFVLPNGWPWVDGKSGLLFQTFFMFMTTTQPWYHSFLSEKIPLDSSFTKY